MGTLELKPHEIELILKCRKADKAMEGKVTYEVKKSPDKKSIVRVISGGETLRFVEKIVDKDKSVK